MTAATFRHPISDLFARPGIERSDWVDMQLARSFMQDTKKSLPSSLMAIWVMAGVLYQSAASVQLATWLVLSNIMILFRYLVVLQYLNTMWDVSGLRLRVFLEKYDFLWV